MYYCKLKIFFFFNLLFVDKHGYNYWGPQKSKPISLQPWILIDIMFPKIDGREICFWFFSVLFTI